MSVTITMPQLGETVTEGTILAWMKQVGEYVAEDEILVEISTDKVDTEIPSPANGVLAEILVAAGTTIDVGTPIAILSDEGTGSSETTESAEATPTPEPAPEPEAEVEPPAPQVETATPASTVPPAGTERRGILSPVVRKLASEYGIDLAVVVGSGDGGRITRKDVEAFISAQPAQESPVQEIVEPAGPEVAVVSEPAPSLPAEGDVREIPRLRKRIAQNMSTAREVAAHVWTSVEVDYQRVETVRTAHRDAFKEAEGFSLTYLPFIARATMEALSAYPVVNSEFDLDAGTHTFHRHVNLGLAVDLDQKGLIVANIPGADSMTMRAIARSIRTTAVAARSGKLGPDDLVGYTFSITNPGPFGSFMSAPIIPPPNPAILSTDTIKKRPVVVEMPDGADGIAIHHVGYLGLSWDHRVFDGSTAVLFLSRIKENLETWDWEQELR